MFSVRNRYVNAIILVIWNTDATRGVCVEFNAANGKCVLWGDFKPNVASGCEGCNDVDFNALFGTVPKAMLTLMAFLCFDDTFSARCDFKIV